MNNYRWYSEYLKKDQGHLGNCKYRYAAFANSELRVVCEMAYSILSYRLSKLGVNAKLDN